MKLAFSGQSLEGAGEKIEKELTRVVDLINNDQTMQASFIIKTLMDEAAGTSNTEIRKLMEKSFEEKSWQAALFLGQALLRNNQKDHLLYNMLGNCSRHLGHSLAANNYYKQSFSINRDFDLALLNIAASLAKIDRYDEELIELRNSFPIVDQTILPDFMVPAKTFLHHKISAVLIKEWKIQINEYVQELILQLEIAKFYKLIDEVHAIHIKIEKEKKRKFPKRLRFARCRTILLKLLTLRWGFLPPDRMLVLEIAVFDLVLYEYKEQKYFEARQHLLRLKHNQSGLFYVDFMVNMCQWQMGNKEEAIIGMKSCYDENPSNRYILINLGQMYGKKGNRLQEYRFLLLGAIRIEELKGQIFCTDILKKAKSQAKIGQLKDAITLYSSVVKEVNTFEIWYELGALYQMRDNLKKAAESYQRALEFDPDSKTVTRLLLEIHDSWLEEAEEYRGNNQFPRAIECFELALEIFRLPQTLKRAGQTYAILKQPGKSRQMLRESQIRLLEEEEKHKKTQLNELIKQGKADLRARDYNPAINNFRTAFQIKPSKDIFMFLVSIYKNLNRKRALSDLMLKWKSHKNHEARSIKSSD